MADIKCLQTGLIYKNPTPHVRSIHAYFPSVVVMSNGEMLATIVLGEAFESINMRTNICRSKDNGRTWQLKGPIYSPPTDRLLSDGSRLTALDNGQLVVFMLRCDRTDHPSEGLTNHENLGFVPTELTTLRSHDFGHTFSQPKPFTAPLVGPAYELCSPITVLKDGRWILPTQTWPSWDGTCPNGIKMVAFVSHDQGQTWPDYMDVMSESAGKVFFWESKIVELPDGRLMATAWAYDDNANKDWPNQYAISDDGGKTWSPPKSTGLLGQTLTPFALEDGRIVCIYRRMDKTGLWANLSELKGDKWINLAEKPLWGADLAGLTQTSEDMAANFNVLRFGAPCITLLDDGTLFTAFWCYEQCTSVIRWFNLQV